MVLMQVLDAPVSYSQLPETPSSSTSTLGRVASPLQFANVDKAQKDIIVAKNFNGDRMRGAIRSFRKKPNLQRFALLQIVR